MLYPASFLSPGKSDMPKVVNSAPAMPRKSLAAATPANNRGEAASIPPPTNLELVRKVFDKSEAWVAPATTTYLTKLEGKGSAGSPGGTNPDTYEFLDVTAVSAVNVNGNGPFQTLSWEEVNAYNTRIAQIIGNTGGSGSDSTGFLSYTGYTGDGTAYWQFQPISWYDAIPGTAAVLLSGWGSGFIIAGANGRGRVRYTRAGSSYPPSTGGSSTAFGQTFPGSYDTAPVTWTYVTDPSKLVVTPGQSYQINVSANGQVIIEYYQ